MFTRELSEVNKSRLNSCNEEEVQEYKKRYTRSTLGTDYKLRRVEKIRLYIHRYNVDGGRGFLPISLINAR